MISREAILKLAATIERRDKVDAAAALRKAERWAQQKDADAAEVKKLAELAADMPADLAERRVYLEKHLGPGACMLTRAERKKGRISPRCPCDGCGGGLKRRAAKAEKAYRGSMNGW